jgi:site-specific DNA-methyltransferase (adenine-specific)
MVDDQRLGASRFFYCPKVHGTVDPYNTHPTVKPTELLRWLVRLVCPPGGTVLDPFSGSGTTGVACIEEGCQYIGIELDEGYVTIGRRRVAQATQRANSSGPRQLPLGLPSSPR